MPTPEKMLATIKRLALPLQQAAGAGVGPAARLHSASAGAAGETGSTKLKLVVLGGNGFVGSAICRAALSRPGVTSVSSVSRTGPPKWAGHDAPWAQRVDWVRADVGDAAALSAALSGAHGVVSCIGAFGSDAFMERVNGGLNVGAAKAARDAGAKRFVFVSAHDFSGALPPWVLRGYFAGKRAAEAAALECFPDRATLLRPAMISGTRYMGNGLPIPLGLVGKPLSLALGSAPWLQQLKYVGPLLAPPVSVEAVAAAAVDAVTAGEGDRGLTGVVTVNDLLAYEK